MESGFALGKNKPFRGWASIEGALDNAQAHFEHTKSYMVDNVYNLCHAMKEQVWGCSTDLKASQIFSHHL